MVAFGSTSAQGSSSQAATANDEEASSPSQLLGYKEWKRNQVFDARKSLDEFKSPQLSKMAKADENNSDSTTVDNSGDNSESDNANNNSQNSEAQSSSDPAKNSQVADATAAQDASSSPNIEEKAERLRQLEFNLEIAQGLTIHDYFALYLKSKSKAEMAEAIKKLSPDELSELLMAYRKSLYGVPEVEATQETAFK